MKRFIEGGAGGGLSVLHSKKVIAILAISILLTSVFYGGYVYGQALTTVTISSGVFPLASYTIWRDGATYYAKSIYGANDYSGTNASLVVNNAIGTGSETIVFVASSTPYEFTSRIVVQNNTHLYGYGATLFWSGSSQQSGIIWDSSVWAVIGVTVRGWREGISIEGFTFNCNSTSFGVHFERTRQSTIKHNKFINSVSGAASADILWGHGDYGNNIKNNVFLNSSSQANIWLTGGIVEDYGVFDTYISQNYLWNYTSRGIFLEGFGFQKQVHITDNTLLGRNASGGIEVSYFLNTIISGNYIAYNFHGISIIDSNLGQSQDITVSENILEFNQWHGIFLDNSTNVLIGSNTIKDNNQNLNVYGSGIFLSDALNTTIIGNHIYRTETSATQRYGIREVATTDYTVILGVTTRNNFVTGISINGTASRVSNSWNATTYIRFYNSTILVTG